MNRLTNSGTREVKSNTTIKEVIDKCKVTEWVRISSDKPEIPYQKPKVLTQSDSINNMACRNFIMGRFTGR